MSDPTPSSLRGPPLVVCVVCGSLVNQANAEKRDIENEKGAWVSTWVCKSCLNLGSEKGVRKYVFKEEKKGLGR